MAEMKTTVDTGPSPAADSSSSIKASMAMKDGYFALPTLAQAIEKDPEAGYTLDDMTAMEIERMMRWGFVRKVYGIVSFQLIVTLAIATVMTVVHPVREYVLHSTPLLLIGAVLSLILMFPLYYYRHSHPANLVLVMIWTITISYSVGISCCLYPAKIIIEAVGLTLLVVISLMIYTFRASKHTDFSRMGPMLISALMVFCGWTLIQVFFRPGPATEFIVALLGALLFSCFIVYDTHNLLTKYSLDEYVWASVVLYLDMINLFLQILRLLGGRGGRS